MLYSQLAITPLTHGLQFLHWKKSAWPNWYWFFRQPHTVSCFRVHGVSSICCNSEEKNEKWLYQPHLQLRPLLRQQVLLAPNLHTGKKKRTKAAKSISDCSNFASLIPVVPESLPLRCPCTHSVTFFPGLLTHLATPSRPSPTNTTHVSQDPQITHLHGTVYTGSIFSWCCQQLWTCH